MPQLVQLAPWWAALALLSSPSSLDPGEFLEGPLVDAGSGRHAWLARRASRAWVCWRAPLALDVADTPCFEPLPLPAVVEAAGDWRMRFASDDRLELLDPEGQLWIRERAAHDWTPAAQPSADPALLRSTLFFAGESAPCSRLGRPVPTFDAGEPTWRFAPCPPTCRESSLSPRPIPKLAGVRARAFISASRARQLDHDFDGSLTPEGKSLSWETALWLGLDLAFDADHRRLARQPQPRPARRSCEVTP